MIKQVVRNDPCPCGSGKKFKQCHGEAAQRRDDSDEAKWRRVGDALDGYPSMLLRFIGKVYGPVAIDEAWDEFTLWPDDGSSFEPETPHIEVFMPWFFHQWAPDPTGTSIEDPSLHDRCPTNVLLERNARRLDPVLRRYLTACLAAPFSFHEVLRSDPGRALFTRDLFTGTENEVLERSASRTLQRGDTFFGQLISCQGITLIEACGLHPIPPDEKLRLIDFRERIARGNPLSRADVKDLEIEIRAMYLDLMDRFTNPPAPRLHNTDSEEIVFHRLLFVIDSPRAALAALKDLALDETEDELLADAELDPAGALRRVAFAWKAPGNTLHKGWQNTIHGHLEIDGPELRAEVNSAERAARIRSIIEERMGEAVRHERTEVESVEDAARRHALEGPDIEDQDLYGDLGDVGTGGPSHGGGSTRGPTHSPEARAIIREMTAAHYEGWISESIPALGGLTPIEAVRDPVGREKVDALITAIERGGARMDPPIDPAVFVTMRERLGLEAC